MPPVIKDLGPESQRIDVTNMVDSALDAVIPDVCFMQSNWKSSRGSRNGRLEGNFTTGNWSPF